MSLDVGLEPADVETTVVLPPSYENHRREVRVAVIAAVDIVRSFAARYGWAEYVQKRFFRSVEIYATQDALWRRMLALNEINDLPIPTDALTAGLEKDVLLALTREEAERARPEYFRSPRDWVKALAHELVHRLHVRILHGNEDAMGPEWFYEGFAIVGSNQPLGQNLEVRDVEQALELAHTGGRGAYARYAAALRFLAARIPLPELIERASTPDFENWLRSECGRLYGPTAHSHSFHS